MVKVPILKVNLMLIMMIFIYKGIFRPTIVVTMLRIFIITKQIFVAVMIIIFWRWVSRIIYFEGNGTEENNEAQTDDEQSSCEDFGKCTSPLKSLNVDETYVVFSVVGKSISQEEKLTFLDKQPCQPSKVILLKRKKKICKKMQMLFRRFFLS